MFVLSPAAYVVAHGSVLREPGTMCVLHEQSATEGDSINHRGGRSLRCSNPRIGFVGGWPLPGHAPYSAAPAWRFRGSYALRAGLIFVG